MLSVVMPSFNEAAIIEATVREWHAEVVSRIPDAELLVVDDCSTDDTATVVERLARELPGVRCLRLERNGGHGRALRHGFQNVSRPYVFQTDSDRQHRPSDFWSLWDLREQNDFVFGARAHRADGMVRIAITRAMRLLIWSLWRIWIRDANCPFKLMRAQALTRVLSEIPEDSFIPMVMVSILARRYGYRVREVGVAHLPRTGGTQSLKGLKRWIGVAKDCTRQMWNFRKTAKHTGQQAGRTREEYVLPQR
jgi:dolichol-phosphate mannosyltransferase